MPSLYKVLVESHFLPHDLGKKNKLYGKISLFDWGGDLNEQWYVYYSYRHPLTGKLTRQNNLYGHINSFDKAKDRRAEAARMKQALKEWLEEGNSPYDTIARKPKTISIIQTARDAIAFALKHAEKTYALTSYPDFKSRVKQFEAYLENRNMLGTSIKDVTKIDVADFLNLILERTSPRNRNNTRTTLSSMFTILKENFIVDVNIVEEISVMEAKPVKNKSFSTEQEEKLIEILEDPKYFWLHLWVKFVAFGLMREIEANRITIGDISIRDKVVRYKAKNHATKTRIIPSILFDELPELSKYNKTDFLFTPTGPGPWPANEVNRRNHFTKWFKEVKDQLGLGTEYGPYSYRHTSIIKMYRELRMDHPPFEAKSRLMHYTGHSTMKALDQYLREIDAELPEDYSHLLRAKQKK